jgi:hypothetical protein
MRSCMRCAFGAYVVGAEKENGHADQLEDAALTGRIDRCYLVAAGTRIAEKRQRYIALARGYRTMLARPEQIGGKGGKPQEPNKLC